MLPVETILGLFSMLNCLKFSSRAKIERKSEIQDIILDQSISDVI